MCQFLIGETRHQRGDLIASGSAAVICLCQFLIGKARHVWPTRKDGAVENVSIPHRRGATFKDGREVFIGVNQCQFLIGEARRFVKLSVRLNCGYQPVECQFLIGEARLYRFQSTGHGIHSVHVVSIPHRRSATGT